MQPKVLLIIAKEKFQEEELFHTKEELENAGCSTTIASTGKGDCFGKNGKKAIATLALADAHHENFDAIAFIGGPGAHTLFDNKNAHRLAREFHENNKPVGAICAAPGILANTDLLQGKKATCFADERPLLQKKGALLQTRHVVEDHHLITADGPAAARVFAKTLVHQLDRKKKL